MRPEAEFLLPRTPGLPLETVLHNERFWAHIRTISEELGYTVPKTGEIFAPPDIQSIAGALRSLGLKTEHVAGARGSSTAFGAKLLSYLRFRAKVLNQQVHPLLMNASQAKAEFIRCVRKYRPEPLSLPWNKQKHDKKAPAFLTAIVNMVLASVLGEGSCDFDPLSLTTVTIDREPFRTLARRVDGAYPSVINPAAVWEIKEYYYTTTFGSRVADAVYETLVDGLELEGLEASPHGKIYHYLIVDAVDTWWGQGNPYLCRIIDMLHMGYIDGAVFGREVESAMTEAALVWRASDALRRKRNPQVAHEEAVTRLTPPPRHKRLQPKLRYERALAWNTWATLNELGDLHASPVESDSDKQIRLSWQRRRNELPANE